MKVTKEVTFDSAHMLSNYSGKCHNLHGHTYKLQVSVESSIQTEGNSKGMVMDFNDLKDVIESITERFDHSLIFSRSTDRSEAEDALLEWAEKYNMNYIILPGKSTSETMADFIQQVVYEELDIPNINVGVRLWETPTSFAEV